MTPVERLQAAIDKLESWAAGGETWLTWSDDAERAYGGICTSDGREVGQMMGTWQARAVVALHGTIDAQLAILRAAIKSRSAAQQAVDIVGDGVTVDQLLHGLDHAALALADAILRGEA